jgi:hypothetical protein
MPDGCVMSRVKMLKYRGKMPLPHNLSDVKKGMRDLKNLWEWLPATK